MVLSKNTSGYGFCAYFWSSSSSTGVEYDIELEYGHNILVGATDEEMKFRKDFTKQNYLMSVRGKKD
jgi:hypothetical protein